MGVAWHCSGVGAWGAPWGRQGPGADSCLQLHDLVFWRQRWTNWIRGVLKLRLSESRADLLPRRLHL